MIYDEIKNLLCVGKNLDLFIREVDEDNFSFKLIFFSSLIDEYYLMELQRSLREAKEKEDVYNKLDNIKISKSSNVDEIILLLHEGQVGLYLVDSDYMIMVDLRKTPSRGIQEPDSEKSIRGSKEGFSELLINNISLLRIHIKSNDLIVEGLRVGKLTSTNVSLVYLNNQVDKRILSEVKKRINSLNLDSLVMVDRALEENILRQHKTIFPLVRYSERVDVTSLYIIRGHIAILIDTSSSCIILPISIFDHFKSVEEYTQNYIIGNFIKILRYIGIFLSIFFIPVCYLLSTNTSIINIINSQIENTSSLPLSYQFLIGYLVIELFRIANVHTPNVLSSALTLVIGIIIGEVTMSLGLFTKDVLLVLSIGTICSFSIPSYELSLTNRVLSLLFLIVSILFGNVGFLITLIILFIHVVSLKPLSYPYLYPLIPLDLNSLKEKVFKNKKKKKV